MGEEEIGCSSCQSELRAPALPLLRLWLSLEQLLERTRRAELGSPASCSLGLDRRSPPSLNIKRTPSAISVPGRPSEKNTHVSERGEKEEEEREKKSATKWTKAKGKKKKRESALLAQLQSGNLKTCRERDSSSSAHTHCRITDPGRNDINRERRQRSSTCTICWTLSFGENPRKRTDRLVPSQQHRR